MPAGCGDNRAVLWLERALRRRAYLPVPLRARVHPADKWTQLCALQRSDKPSPLPAAQTHAAHVRPFAAIKWNAFHSTM